MNGKNITLCFYKKEENVNLSFAVMQSDESGFSHELIDELLTDQLLSLCNTKTVKEKNITFAVNGIFNKLKTIIGSSTDKLLLHDVSLKNGTTYSNKTKKEVYSLIKSQNLTEDDISYVTPLSGDLQGLNIKPFFFNTGKRFKKSKLEKI